MPRFEFERTLEVLVTVSAQARMTSTEPLAAKVLRCARPSLGLVATHLNAPAGPIVSPEHLVRVFRAGSLEPLQSEPRAQALISYLFVEVSPALVGACAAEAGASLSQAHALYLDTLANGAVRCPAWEEAMKDCA